MFDNAHRDETVKVRKRHSPRSKPSDAILAATTSSAWNYNAISNCSEPPRGLSTSAESDALGFFFLHYSRSDDLDATCSVFSILPDMYAKSPMSSPLNNATRALALQVTRLHRAHSGRTSVGGELYVKAVSQVKEAITVPAKCRSEDLLLATLVLDAYDNLNTTFRRWEHDGSRSSPHLRGSIALLQYRGDLNYGDDLSWRLVTATRNRFLHHCWHSADALAGIETIQKIWGCDNDGKPRGPAVEADTLAFRLSWLRHLRREVSSTKSPSRDRTDRRIRQIEIDDTAKLKDLLSQASRLANDCARLQNNLPLKWQPTSVPASSLATSIQAVSVYEHVSPTVYSRLSIANSTNRQRLTELGCVSLIGSCLAKITGVGEPRSSPQRGLMPSPLLARAQVLIDEISASVPFITGNVTADAFSDTAVMVPSAVLRSPEGGHGKSTLPENITKHRQQVVASGLYMMYTTLKALLEVAGSDNMVDAMGNLPRAGQVEWIEGQVDRLGAILPFAIAKVPARA